MLTAENYFSPENSMRYMGVSQFKAFQECESRGLAEAQHIWRREQTPSMLVGSYIDAHFSKELPLFEAQHPEIFLKGGGLKSEFRHALDVITRIERDPFFMKFITGQPQVILTGTIVGVEWKIKIDSYHPGKAVVDLKVMKDFEPQWKDGQKLNFVEYWGYHTQGAVYQAVEGNGLPFILACATKQDEPDLEVLSIPNDVLEAELERIKSLAPRYAAIKRGEIEPERCGKCDYCRSTKVLSKVIDYRDIA